MSFLPKDKWEISVDPPGEIARKLSLGHADVGLVPVAAIPGMKQARLINSYGIAANGPVNSVFLFSRRPIHEIQQVLLDFESRTSVALVRVLARNFWKINCDFVPAYEGYENLIQGHTAGVIIGDRAIRAMLDFEYRYDLSEAWKQMTSLPFVFARWVSCVELENREIAEFTNALQRGLEQKDLLLLRLIEEQNWNPEFIIKYLKESILYKIDEDAERGMRLFLEQGKDFFY